MHGQDAQATVARIGLGCCERQWGGKHIQAIWQQNKRCAFVENPKINSRFS
jgi:hypothetical protein